MKAIQIMIGCIIIPFLLLQKSPTVSRMKTPPHQKMNTFILR